MLFGVVQLTMTPICYFSLEVLSRLGYGVEKTGVWVHNSCLDFAVEKIRNWVVDP